MDWLIELFNERPAMFARYVFYIEAAVAAVIGVILKKKGKKALYYDGFRKWLDEQIPKYHLDDAVAFHFNLYEDTDDRWSVELVGTGAFSVSNPDWACKEVFATRENPYVIHRTASFQEVLEIFKKCAVTYLNKGTYKEKLKEKAGVGIGFVDGDLEILYQNPNYRSAAPQKNEIDKAEEERQQWLQQRFAENLKYISQTEIAVETIEKQFVEDDRHIVMPVGRSHFPTGRIVVADPLAYLPANKFSPELEVRIPKGKYSVHVSIYRSKNIGIRMCTVRLKVKDTKPVKYVCAASTEESAAASSGGKAMSGFPVDAGMVTICDAKVAAEYREFLDGWHKENPGKNHYDDYFADFFAKSYEMFPGLQRKGGDFMVWTNPIHHRNMIMVASGFGDGFYQSYIGYDENQEVCQIIVPMVNPELFEDDDTQQDEKSNGNAPGRAASFAYTASMPHETVQEIIAEAKAANEAFRFVNRRDTNSVIEQIYQKVNGYLGGKPFPKAYETVRDAAIALGSRFAYAYVLERNWDWMMVGDSEETAQIAVVSPKHNYCIFPFSYMLKILEGKNVGPDGNNDNTVLLLWNMTEKIDDQPRDKTFVPLS